jgi:hypothetical protein
VSYALLTGLYFSEASNADLTSPAARALLHIATPLEDLLAAQVAAGRDVVLTGNPGDGKSHLIRILEERGALGRAIVERDLSARQDGEVLGTWSAARAARRPFVLGANEGPLVDLVGKLAAVSALARTGAEITRQLGHLLVHRPEDLPQEPAEVVVVDLADRSVLDREIVEAAIARVASEVFLPDLPEAPDTSAGRNLLALRRSPEARRRLAGALVAAGQRAGEHITFRQLWQAIAYALTRARRPTALRQEVTRDEVGIETFPLGNLVDTQGRGPLLAAARAHSDPARVTDPELDEQLWSTGQPTGGSWLVDDAFAPGEPPARLWERGLRAEALAAHAALKRVVALLHERGGGLIDDLADGRELPSRIADTELLAATLRGLRALYLAPDEEREAPDWVREGLPLWVGLSYGEQPPSEWPHVAVSARRASELAILRPRRVPWLASALGPAPEVAWLTHRESGIALRIDQPLLAALRCAAGTSGPIPLPEPVRRFMARIAGWEEAARDLGTVDNRAVFLRRPRGRLEASALTRGEREASYGVG